MKILKTKDPYIYQKFLVGDFVVKTNEGSFNAVGCDMKSEQTIHRSAKSTMGIIGKTKSLDYVSEWQLIYHKVMDITNTFRTLTDSIDKSKGICISRHLSDKKIAFYNESVNSMMSKKKTLIVHRKSNGNKLCDSNLCRKNCCK